MLFSTTKPLYEIQKQLRYIKHRNALDQIIHTSHNQPQPTSTSFRKIHHQSLSYHQHHEQQSLEQQNSKMYERLVRISHRKGRQYWQGGRVPSIRQFDTPARRQRERAITESNNMLALNLITKKSQFDRDGVRKNMARYELLKKTMYNNKQVLRMARLKTVGIQPLKMDPSSSPLKQKGRGNLQATSKLKQTRLSSV